MAVAGYSCLVRKSGVSTAITTEPMSIMSSTSVKFRITDSARRVIDPNTAWHIKNGTTTMAYSDIAALDYMFSEFTLNAPVADGSVTSLSFSGSYLPITTSSDTILETKSFSLSENNDLLGTDVFTGTTQLGIRRRMTGLQDVSLEVNSIARDADLVSLASVQQAGVHVVAEVFFGEPTHPRFRGICLIENIDRETAVEGLVETTIGFKIASVRNEPSGLVAGYAHKVFPG